MKEWETIVRETKRLGKNSDLRVRDELVKAWSKVKIMEINGYRTLTDSLNGTHNAALLGACNKMFWSEAHHSSMELAIDILGMEGQILTGKGDAESIVAGSRRGRADYPVSELQASFFLERGKYYANQRRSERDIGWSNLFGITLISF